MPASTVAPSFVRARTVGENPHVPPGAFPASGERNPERESTSLLTVGDPEKPDSHIQMRNWLFPRSPNALLHV